MRTERWSSTTGIGGPSGAATEYFLSNIINQMIIDGYGRQELPAEQVARTWLQDHPERVATFLDGITTRAGKPALEAVKASLD